MTTDEERLLRALYDAGDLAEAERRDPRALERIWEELGKQLREEIEREAKMESASRVRDPSHPGP